MIFSAYYILLSKRWLVVWRVMRWPIWLMIQRRQKFQNRAAGTNNLMCLYSTAENVRVTSRIIDLPLLYENKVGPLGLLQSPLSSPTGFKMDETLAESRNGRGCIFGHMHVSADSGHFCHWKNKEPLWSLNTTPLRLLSSLLKLHFFSWEYSISCVVSWFL